MYLSCAGPQRPRREEAQATVLSSSHRGLGRAGADRHTDIHTDSMIPADRGLRHTPGPNRLSSGERGGERQEGNTQRPLLGAAVLLTWLRLAGGKRPPPPTPSPAPSTSSAGSRKGPQSRPRWAWESHSASWGLGVLIHEVGRTMARRPSSQSNQEHLPSARCVAGRADPAQTTLPCLRKVKVTGGDGGGPRTSRAC